MNLLANNESHYLNDKDLAHKEIAVNESKHRSTQNRQAQLSQHEQTLYNDVSTASYVRGYN